MYGSDSHFQTIEEVVIPYRSPIDKKMHRYFVDFFVRTKSADGSLQSMLVEIKPKKQTVEPIMEGKKATKGNIETVRNWIVNTAKWEAAREYCADRKWIFRILTEEDIFGRKEKA
jgi:hypothetical protein